MQSYRKEHQDIKICRLCGSDDKENVDIFSQRTSYADDSNDLLNKILTVYPLVLYKDDPLPQHICPKCINNVSICYYGIQQVLRQQYKWMGLTRAVHPEHTYFRVLNAIEKSSKTTKESIKISYNIEINQQPIKKLLTLPRKEMHDSSLRKLLTLPSKEMQQSTVTNVNNLKVNENVVKNIQTKLESNGFTIKRIKVPPPPIVTTTQDFSNSSNSLNTQNTTSSISTAATLLETAVTCKYCKLKFSNLKVLAQHQIIHLKLSTNKIFQKRILPKHLRRGRLITINEAKTIRCLNCWRIYRDNKAILHHWSSGDCEFYCCICSKDFPHSPKMLREHIPKVHGISYRSAIRQYAMNRSELIQSLPEIGTVLKMPTKLTAYKQHYAAANRNKYKKPPRTCTKNDDGTITCKVCHAVFDNFRSSNSHMRKHKPAIKYGEKSFSFGNKVDTYNTQDDYMMQPSTSHHQWNPHAFAPAPAPVTPTTFPIQRPPRPNYRVITNNGPLHGIRTKIVQKRHEFLASNRQELNTGLSVRSIESLNSNVPSTSNDNLIVPELMPIIKSEPMFEHETQNNEGVTNSFITSPTEPPPQPVIKAEISDNSLADQPTNFYICFICNENFAGYNEYQMHTMFVHNMS